MRAALLIMQLGVLLAAAAPTTIDKSRARIKQLTPSELARVSAHLDAFDKLPNGEKEQLRKLHVDLEAAGEERVSLEETLARYMQWRDSLTASQRAELDDAKTSKERMEILQRLVREQKSELVAVIARMPKPTEDPRGSRPPAFGFPFGPRREFRWPNENELRIVERHLLQPTLGLNELEKMALTNKTLSQRSRAMLLANLAVKYELSDLSEELKRLARFANAPWKNIIAARRWQPGGEALPTEKLRKQWEDGIHAAIYVAPPMDMNVVQDTVEKMEELQRGGFYFLLSFNPDFAQRLMTLHYFQENPDKIPKELRDLLKPLLVGDKPQRAAPKLPRAEGPLRDMKRGEMKPRPRGE